MNKLGRWLVLIIGALAASIIIATYGQTAIQTVAGLAVAQTGTQWNNVKDLAFGDNMTNGVLAAGVVVYDGTNFDRVRGDTSNGLDVDVTRVSGTVTVAGDNTPADNYANPTDAFDTNTLLSAFDGSTWDRVRSGAINADNVTALTLGVLQTGAYLFGFDGSTWDRLLVSTHGDSITTTAGLNVASILYGFDGTNYDRVRALANNADDVAASASGNLSTQAFVYETDGTAFDRVRHSFTQSTTGITTNAAGTTVTMTTSPPNKYTMIINRTAGSTDTVEVDLQCSIDNTAFVQIATITSLAGEPVLTNVGDIPCFYMRYNVVTVGSGNTLAIDLLAVR